MNNAFVIGVLPELIPVRRFGRLLDDLVLGAGNKAAHLDGVISRYARNGAVSCLKAGPEFAKVCHGVVGVNDVVRQIVVVCCAILKTGLQKTGIFFFRDPLKTPRAGIPPAVITFRILHMVNVLSCPGKARIIGCFE